MSNWTDHSSFLGHIGGYGDRILNPLSWVTKGKWTHLTSDVLPEKVNSGLSTVMKPFDKVDQTINPVRKIPIVDRAANITKSKPGDALAIAAGAYFGGGALMGGAGGGTAVGGGATAGGTADVGGLAALDSGAVTAEGAAPELMAGGGGAAAGTADVGGLAAADSAAVDAEGAEPGLTESYGNASSSGSSTSSTSKAQRMQQMSKLMQQMAQQQQRQVDQSRVSVEAPALQNPYATSTKAAKTAPTGNVQQALMRGAAGGDPIDANGVQAAAIQEISKRITAAKARLAQLQKESQ